MTDHPETLDALWRMAETALTRGVADRKHPARHPVLATTGPDGPEQRVLVLRGWQGGVARLQTDAATAKVRELRADPRCSLHVWVPKQSLQIRLKARVEMVPGTEEAWRNMPEAAREVYGGTPTPGVPISAPDDFTPGAELARYLVLHLQCHAAEVLHLGAKRHVRATYLRDSGAWRGQWVAP
ncbi:pyridoxamine 5'-phosphate oxidase family protein [Pseudaestuariivita sp.]|uniref:pyridoxamine 5'-phosphate oxidase family protein n=1 Tax=Pseudaestuariivita sp. TaxID=2211669 RepID=UPI00405A0146